MDVSDRIMEAQHTIQSKLSQQNDKQLFCSFLAGRNAVTV